MIRLLKIFKYVNTEEGIKSKNINIIITVLVTIVLSMETECSLRILVGS